ncbi:MULTISPECIES: Blp family class II bacteriocin [Lysinibacillus]|uniref:Blp family class II bacteriocin n=1 Tax=Lysinibacillus TaxID=400634 RepID=UPI000ACD6208|nr:Blp family class II bacteriocin [Lysinibacillus sphaericus]
MLGMNELSEAELMEIDGGGLKNEIWNTIQTSAGFATVGGLVGGPAGAVVGAHYGAVAYIIGYAIDKK